MYPELVTKYSYTNLQLPALLPLAFILLHSILTLIDLTYTYSKRQTNFIAPVLFQTYLVSYGLETAIPEVRIYRVIHPKIHG